MLATKLGLIWIVSALLGVAMIAAYSLRAADRLAWLLSELAAQALRLVIG